MSSLIAAYSSSDSESEEVASSSLQSAKRAKSNIIDEFVKPSITSDSKYTKFLPKSQKSKSKVVHIFKLPSIIDKPTYDVSDDDYSDDDTFSSEFISKETNRKKPSDEKTKQDSASTAKEDNDLGASLLSLLSAPKHSASSVGAAVSLPGSAVLGKRSKSSVLDSSQQISKKAKIDFESETRKKSLKTSNAMKKASNPQSNHASDKNTIVKPVHNIKSKPPNKKIYMSNLGPNIQYHKTPSEEQRMMRIQQQQQQQQQQQLYQQQQQYQQQQYQQQELLHQSHQNIAANSVSKGNVVPNVFFTPKKQYFPQYMDRHLMEALASGGIVNMNSSADYDNVGWTHSGGAPVAQKKVRISHQRWNHSAGAKETVFQPTQQAKGKNQLISLAFKAKEEAQKAALSTKEVKTRIQGRNPTYGKKWYGIRKTLMVGE